MDASEFCLVLTPTWGAAGRASEAISERFRLLAEEIRAELAAVVAELVQSSVDQRPNRPITVAVAVDADGIHGEVSNQAGRVEFEIPLAR